MSGSMLQIGLYLLASTVAGVVVGWLIRGVSSSRSLGKLRDDLQIKYDEATRQRDRFNSENTKLRTSIEAMQSMVHKHEVTATRGRTELESAREKLKSLSKDLVALGGIRDQLQGEVDSSRGELASAKYQLREMEAEFEKAGAFYKAELEKAFEKRKTVETKLDDAKAEHESLSNLLEASKSENESINKMMASAQTRLDNLDEIERNAIELKAENAELKHDATRTKQELDSLRREVAEMEALKVQNRELSHCLTSMENSRQQYERDAKRYRDQAEQSEQLSDTLRLKLDDVEQNLSEIAQRHDEAVRIAQDTDVAQEPNGQEPSEQEKDDLTKIVGIGKVFQHTLHALGIYSYRQIANFGPADIARVNMALKDNKGRLEQDDWIGQAKELYFQKHSEMVEH